MLKPHQVFGSNSNYIEVNERYVQASAVSAQAERKSLWDYASSSGAFCINARSNTLGPTKIRLIVVFRKEVLFRNFIFCKLRDHQNIK